ncbi:anti-sigma factor domain-containing protein [Paenibacillus sp. sgz5001063]|uniref:anti-sigma factor domain-containing protein n=1 Tax=Paenibacillus sp. sgz5001063 TaxID=3242474 RepID=UPI0036D31713
MDEADDHICDWAELYVLGGLDEAQQQEYETHLADCADCREQVDELREIIDVLPLASVEVLPPEGMRARVLGRVLPIEGMKKTTFAEAEEQNAVQAVHETIMPPVAAPETPFSPSAAKMHTVPVRRSRLLRSVCAALAVTAAALAIYSFSLQRDVSGLKKQLALTGAPSTELKVNEVVQLGPAAQDIVAKGLATIVIDAKGTHLLVQAEKLPELSGSEAFQVWLIKGDVKKSAGTFVSSGGTGAMYYTFDPQGYDTVAITLEPDGQGEQPRGRPILVAKIEG